MDGRKERLKDKFNGRLGKEPPEGIIGKGKE